MLVGVAASGTKIFRNQNHRFQSKFAYCKLFGVYAGVILSLECNKIQDNNKKRYSINSKLVFQLLRSFHIDLYVSKSSFS